MAQWFVTIPIAGSITVEVTAADEVTAKAAAWDKIEESGEDAGDLEWEFHDRLCYGNVCGASCRETEVDEA